MKIVVILLICVVVILGTCGARKPKVTTQIPTLDGRIVGSSDVNIEDYPYLVALERFDEHVCDAALISEKWVITTGYCANIDLIYEYSIRVGSSIRNTGGQTYKISTIIRHPNYTIPALDYDLALIELSTPVQFDYKIQPPEIAPTGIILQVGSTFTISGWGDNSDFGDGATVLQHLELVIISKGDCQDIYGTRVTDRMFCARIIVTGDATCGGNFGGPAIVEGFLTGLVSWGEGCAGPDKPVVLSLLPNMREWIFEIGGA